MDDSGPAHFRGMPRWVIVTVVFSAFVLGAVSIGLAWKQSADANANLAFGQRDVDVIAAVAKQAPNVDNEALVVHTLNVIVNLKGITNHQSLAGLAIGAGAAFLAIGFALFLLGADGAFQVQYEGKGDNKLAFYATAPGLLCFLLSACLIGVGATRRYEMQLGDYQQEATTAAAVQEQTPQPPTLNSALEKVPSAPVAVAAGQDAAVDILAGFCVDRFLPRDLVRFVPGVRVGGGRMRAISPIGKFWINGSTLRVAFLDGELQLHKLVQEYAATWSNHANVRFEFGSSPNAEIRVSFNGRGRWSYIGTDARGIPPAEPTMNLGGFTANSTGEDSRSVVLHQFGHALGLSHEFITPPPEGVHWNREVVYSSLAQPPNQWARPDVDRFFFGRYSTDQIVGTQVDPESIMLLPVPKSFTLNGFQTNWNARLSQGDIKFIGGAKAYPKPSAGGVPLSTAPSK